MAERPRVAELIFAGNSNMDLEKTGRQGWDEEIVAAVDTSGLEGLVEHFLS